MILVIGMPLHMPCVKPLLGLLYNLCLFSQEVSLPLCIASCYFAENVIGNHVYYVSITAAGIIRGFNCLLLFVAAGMTCISFLRFGPFKKSKLKDFFWLLIL